MTLVRPETGEIIEALSQQDAERLTQRIALKLDAMADTYAGVMPLIRDAIEREAFRALGYASVSAYISDRFGDSLGKLGVDMRRLVVHELTEAGMSVRSIAPVVGVSKNTVQRDQQVSHVGHLTQTPAPSSLGEDEAARDQSPEGEVDPAHHTEAPATAPSGTATPRPPVVGIDGKTYSRPTPKPQASHRSDAEYAEQDRAEELCEALAKHIALLYAITNPERRAEYVAAWPVGTKTADVFGDQFVTPQHMRDLSAALADLANEWEHANV